MAAAACFLNLPVLPGKRTCLLSYFSHLQLFATLWTIAHQALLSMGFSKRGLPCPPPGDLPHPGIELASFTSTVAGGFFTTSATWEDNRAVLVLPAILAVLGCLAPSAGSRL